MEEGPSRKLAVILHADVVGSTDLGHQNETLAHQRINDTFVRFSKTIESYGGTAHEIRGDALIAEFSRASDAVCAAIAFQNENVAFNESLVDDIQPELRVGLAIGEVVIGNNTITGDGVVLAQRLEQLSAPKGICIQGAAYETVPKRLPFDYENLGDRQLKGFAEPIRAYAVSLVAGESVPSPELGTSTKPAVELPDKPSIAVLPFTNMSRDPDQDYFADGIAEDIITELSRDPNLFVIARNSRFFYKNQSVDIREIARELGMRYVLEGSLRKSGNRIRLNTQLIDAQTNHHVWAERYDRALEDIFEVQDELTITINNTLLRKIADISTERALRRVPRDLDAYDHQLRAFELVWRLDPAENAKAIREAEAAIAIEPNFARGHMTLAWAQLFAVMSGFAEDPAKALELGYEAARKAIAADREDFWGYAALGSAELLMHRHDSALSSVEHALELNPKRDCQKLCLP